MEQNIVAIFDILGTSEIVFKDEFSDLHVFDFANPVGIVAPYNQEMRFSVFSDSVIISSSLDKIFEFVSVVSFLYSHWFADGIFVRGGISVGEINWVDVEEIDKIFRRYKNLSYSRVYGKALVKAHNIEKKSGPGALCFVDEYASKELNSKDQRFIFEGYTDILVWPNEKTASHIMAFTDQLLNGQNESYFSRRHLKSTHHFFKIIIENKRFLPENYLIEY